MVSPWFDNKLVSPWLLRFHSHTWHAYSRFIPRSTTVTGMVMTLWYCRRCILPLYQGGYTITMPRGTTPVPVRLSRCEMVPACSVVVSSIYTGTISVPAAGYAITVLPECATVSQHLKFKLIQYYLRASRLDSFTIMYVITVFTFDYLSDPAIQWGWYGFFQSFWKHKEISFSASLAEEVPPKSWPGVVSKKISLVTSLNIIQNIWE